MILDVVIISASRPKLLPYLMESFKSKIHFNWSTRIMLHEDFVYPDESEKLIDWAKKSNFFDEIHTHNPNIEIGESIQYMLEKVRSKYMFIIQDDWEFELPIDLNHIIWTMKKNSNINCIYFNKRKNLKSINNWTTEELRYNFLPLCLSSKWPLFNGVWRTDFVKKHWDTNRKGQTQESYWNSLIECDRWTNRKSLKNEIGCFTYGPIEFPRVVRHLGSTWSVKPKGSFPIKKDGFGGHIKHESGSFINDNRAPWLPKPSKRPLYLENKEEQLEELKKEDYDFYKYLVSED